MPSSVEETRNAGHAQVLKRLFGGGAVAPQCVSAPLPEGLRGLRGSLLHKGRVKGVLG